MENFYSLRNLIKGKFYLKKLTLKFVTNNIYLYWIYLFILLFI
jgi:hypothetical protein